MLLVAARVLGLVLSLFPAFSGRGLVLVNLGEEGRLVLEAHSRAVVMVVALQEVLASCA